MHGPGLSGAQRSACFEIGRPRAPGRKRLRYRNGPVVYAIRSIGWGQPVTTIAGAVIVWRSAARRIGTAGWQGGVGRADCHAGGIAVLSGWRALVGMATCWA